MADKDFKAGDRVSWNSSQGKVTGTVTRKLIVPLDIKTHHVAASPITRNFWFKALAAGS